MAKPRATATKKADVANDSEDSEPTGSKSKSKPTKTKSKAVKSKKSTTSDTSKDGLPKPKKIISTPPTGTKQKRKRGPLPAPAGAPPKKKQKTGNDPKLARLLPLEPDELQAALKDLNKKIGRWTSAAYQHFEPDVGIMKDGDDQLYHVFTCVHTQCKYVRVATDNSTSNLNGHIKSCNHRAEANQQGGRQPKIDEKFSRYTRGGFRLRLLEWATRRHRPDMIVEDDELIAIFEYLNPDAEVPSARTLRRDIGETFSMTRDGVIQLLKDQPGRFNVILDAWTSPNNIEFLGVLVSFAYQGKLLTICLDMIELTEAHTGDYMATCVYSLLQAFGISDRVLAFIGDNASNNDKMLDCLDTLFPSDNIAGRTTQVRCFGHILNLVYKAICLVFEAKRKRKKEPFPGAELFEDDEEPDLFEDDEDDEEDTDDREERTPARQHLEEEDITLLNTIVGNLTDIVVSKDEELVGILKLGHRCANKKVLQDRLKSLCEQNDLGIHTMVKRVATRWNTMHGVVDRAIKLEKPLDALCMLPEVNKGPAKGRLMRFRLTAEEWDIQKQLLPVLLALNSCTVWMSSSSYPLLHEVIPAIDALHGDLSDIAQATGTPNIIKFAIRRGLAVLDKYYSKTDDSIMWKTAMIMHPRYKTSYFTQQDWPKDWIRIAVESARTTWTKHYKPTITVTVKKAVPLEEPGKTLTRMEKLQQSSQTFSEADPFESYIISAPDDTVEDVIQHWSALLPAPKATRITAMNALARMALDFLSAPATSTDVERLFSHGGLIVSKRRHNLSAQSVRESTVLQNWMKVDGLVPRKEIVTLLNLKRCRTKWDVGISEEESDSGELGETPLPRKKKGGKGKADIKQRASEVVVIESSASESSDDDDNDIPNKLPVEEDDSDSE